MECKKLDAKLREVTERSRGDLDKMARERDRAVSEANGMRQRDVQREHNMRKLEREKDKLLVNCSFPKIDFGGRRGAAT